MKKPAVLRLWAVLCTVIVLNACQKETSKSPDLVVTDDYTGPKMSGSVKEDPAKIAKVPTIMSQDFLSNPQKYMSTPDMLSARGKPVKSGTDATPPSVSITSPSNGSNVSGTVTVNISASDNIGLSGVTLSVDGTLISSGSTAPYSFSWNTSSVADGTHTLTAKASDGSGNTNSTSITVAKNTTITPLPPATFPSSFELVMPPVQNQGGEGACAVFASTYAARSAEQYYKTNASSYSYSTNIFSPEFVYDQTKVIDCGSGTGLTTALDFLVSKGVCTWQSMPYSSSNGCSLVPSTSQMSEAANYRISSYSKLTTSDMTAIKTMLVNKHPVITSIVTDQSFWDAKPGFIWKAYAGPTGISHDLVICGYDDARHAYKIMNSWGTAWGDAGFGWIDYDFLPQAAFFYSYVIND